jgi:trehalose synthase
MRWLLLLPLSVFGIMEPESMLFQAEAISSRYAPFVSKQPPPSKRPKTNELLQCCSNWLVIDLPNLRTKSSSTLGSLSSESLWEWVAEIGFDGVELKGLKGPADAPVSLQIDRNYGTEEEYKALASMAMNKEIFFIGSLVGNATGKGIDFALALKNVGSYPGLYSLIEVCEKDWPLLPDVRKGTISANIPWLMLQKLAEKGYIPQDADPYVKTSDWNATELIQCVDQVTRRWIYWRDGKGHPRLNWLNPTFASERLAAGDALQSIYRFGQPILQLEAGLPESAKECLTLTIRKLGGYSASFCKGGVASLAGKNSDLLYDHLTPMAALHALIAEDAEMLRFSYRLFLEFGIQPRHLIHAMEPFDRIPCDWAELLSSPRKKFRYREEELTGEALRMRLLREDKERLLGLPVSFTWMDVCLSCLQDLNRKKEQVQELHLLLTKFFAWQPGAFALNGSDLLGATAPFNLLEPSETLYASIPTQLGNRKSFASQLKRVLTARREVSLERAELIDIPSVENKGLLLLRYRLPETGYPALLAVNFSKTKASEVLESPDYVCTSAIDLLTGKSLDKTHDSSFFIVNAESYTAQLILFQPKIFRY